MDVLVPVPHEDEGEDAVEAVPVPHEDEGEDAVECGHHDVRQGQVQQVVVRSAPHPLVPCSHNNNNY